MHFSFKNRDSGKFSLQQVSDEKTDVLGFPREFHMDLTLVDVDPLKALTAGLLLFGIDETHGLINSPRATMQLDRTLRSQRGERSPHLTVDPLGEVETDSHTQLILADYRDRAFPIQPGGKGRNVLVQCLDSVRWSGKLFTLDRVEFAANHKIFAAQAGRNETTLLVSVGLLLAGDWKSSMLVVENIGGLSRTTCAELVELCASVGVGLRIVEKNAMERLLNYGEA